MWTALIPIKANDLAVVVDDLPGFNGGVGDICDILRYAGCIVTNGDFSVASRVDGLDFRASIVEEEGSEIFRLTAVEK